MEQKVTCPYCGEKTTVDIEPEDYLTEQDTCSHCGKVFNVTVHVDIDFDTSKCECQGVNHEWELRIAFPRCCSEWVCKHCGETKDLTDDDRKKLGIETVEEYLKSLKK